MKKVLVYILLAVMVMDNTSLDQLYKVTFLVEHFTEHRQIDNNLSLMGFLEMHYWGEDLPDNDDEKDNQLPFKKPIINFHCSYFNRVAQVRIIPPVIYFTPAYGLPKNCELPDAQLDTLFRPPRIQSLS